MKNAKDKPIFYIIILLLVVFLPVCIYGTIRQLKNKKPTEPDNNTYKDGFLYFYEDNKLVGKYKCLGTCSYAGGSKKKKILIIIKMVQRNI